MQNENKWPNIQRDIESMPLELPTQLRPLRMLRRLTHEYESYPPGVYVFAYHTIVDQASAEQWEIAYDKGWVSKNNFERQISYLCRKMVPASLTEAFKILASGNIDRPYFVITFDDGYRDVLRNAAPIVAEYGICPCMFVNGRFAMGNVYYRVLAALLTKKGYSGELRNELLSRDNKTNWSADPVELFNQTKNNYSPGIVEDSVEKVYVNCIGEPSELGVHLNSAEIRELQAAGWEIGNHTYDHRLLSKLDANQISETISNNEKFWRREDVRLIDALAIPNGRVLDVNEHLNVWLQEHQSVHALFCNGGVNFKYDRTQYLRFFGGNGDELLMHEMICAEVKRAKKLWK